MKATYRVELKDGTVLYVEADSVQLTTADGSDSIELPDAMDSVDIELASLLLHENPGES